jgi:MFS family permease
VSAGESRPPAFWRYFAISGLVMGQVIPNFFILSALPAIYRTQGVDLAQIGILSLAMFPFWFKWVWAPIVDRFGSRKIGLRKSWIIPGTTIGAAIYALLTLIPPSADTIYLVAGCLILKNFVMATQDIAVDAWIVESLDRGEEATGAAASSIGTTIGMVVGGSLLVGFYDTLGWQVVMLFASAMLVLGSLVAMILPERQPRGEVAAKPPGLMTSFREIRTHLQSPASWQVLGVVLLIQFSTALALRLEGAFLVDKGLSLSEIGFIAGGATAIGAIFGTLLGEWTGRRFGLRKALAAGAGALALVAVLYVYAAASEITAWEYAVIGLTSTTIGSIYSIAFNGSRFRWSSPVRTGTDYTMQSSLNYAAQATAAFSGALLADALGWTGFFIVSGTVATAAVLFGALVYRRVTAAVDRRDEAAAPVSRDEAELLTAVSVS